jgi:hypothetical protein
LFDIRGRIRAALCTSFGGNDIAFHVSIHAVLSLRAQAQSFFCPAIANYCTYKKYAILRFHLGPILKS